MTVAVGLEQRGHILDEPQALAIPTRVVCRAGCSVCSSITAMQASTGVAFAPRLAWVPHRNCIISRCAGSGTRCGSLILCHHCDTNGHLRKAQIRIGMEAKSVQSLPSITRSPTVLVDIFSGHCAHRAVTRGVHYHLDHVPGEALQCPEEIPVATLG
jgi:hypothetical protein